MIVSNRCGCAPDLVRQGRNGALFDPESIDQLAELSKDAKLFPDFDAAVVSDLRTSLELFLGETLGPKEWDYRRLFLADHLYLNGRLAKIYGGDLPADAPFHRSQRIPSSTDPRHRSPDCLVAGGSRRASDRRVSG